MFLKFFFGKLYIIFAQRFPFFVINKKIIKKINGVSYELDLTQAIDSSLYFFGYFEKDTHKALNKLVTKNMTVFDIGANIGCHTFNLAKKATNGKVYCFEPMPYANKKLKKNHKLNNFKNIIIEEIGLSNKNEKKIITFKSNWPLNKKFRKNATNNNEIEFLKLDEYVNQKKINNIDLIKIDIDGYEFKFFKGAQKSLIKFKPQIIMEIGDMVERFDDNVFEMTAFLKSLGYKFYKESDFSNIDIDKTLKNIPPNKSINVLLKPNE